MVIVTLILTLPIFLAHIETRGSDGNSKRNGDQWQPQGDFGEGDNTGREWLKKVHQGHGANAMAVQTPTEMQANPPPYVDQAMVHKEIRAKPAEYIYDGPRLHRGLPRTVFRQETDENTKPLVPADISIQQKRASFPIPQPASRSKLKRFEVPMDVPIEPKATIPKLPYPESDNAVLKDLEILYVTAPIAKLQFPDSNQETDILMDTGSHTTFVLSPDMCKNAKCINKPFECRYDKGEARGTMYQAHLGLGSLKWTQSIGSACSVKNMNDSIMGLSFGRNADPENEKVLMSWNVPYKAFGFLPQPHFRYDAHREADEMDTNVSRITLADKKLGWMYAGKRLDASTCSGPIARFEIEPQNRHTAGLWNTPHVRLLVDGVLTGDPISVIWDIGSTRTRMPRKYAQLIATEGN